VGGASNRRTLHDAEEFIRNQPFVEDCVVLPRRDADGVERHVAYLVAAGRVDTEGLREIVAHQIDGFVLDAIVPVAVIPCTSDGALDEENLRQVPIVDSTLVRSWEDRISDVTGVRGVVVTPEPYRPPVPAMHLAELLPNWQRGPVVGRDTTVPSIDTSTHERPATTDWSFSEGPALSMPVDAPRTLPEALQRAASTLPCAGVTYVIDERQEVHQTYAALLEDAARILTGLRAAGLQAGDRVLFQLSDARDFLQTFWGCVLGGFVPVPIGVAPSYVQANATLGKLRHAWESLGHPRVVTSANLFSSLDPLGAQWGIEGWEVLRVEALRAHDVAGTWQSCRPDDLALLLLTSGSTGTPKAVMQSHCAILARCQATCEHNDFSAADVSLNWFPLDHVGGLVMFHVRDVFAQCAQMHVPTHHVLEDPLRWLDLIEKHRATITWAPNFAFGLINARAEQLSSRRWDLSSMRFILNAGEAIGAKTARRFLELLSPHDLPGTAMRPAWGMSETCSAVTYSHDFTRATTAIPIHSSKSGLRCPGQPFESSMAPTNC